MNRLTGIFLYLLLGGLVPTMVCGQQLGKVNQATKNVQVFHPKVSFDGTQLVFMADYDGRSKPYVSVWAGTEWSDPQPIFSQEINGFYQFAYPQLNANNDRLYIAASVGDTSDFDIYFSDKTRGGWTDPIPMSDVINTEMDETAPAISTNERKLLFTRPLPEEAKADDFCQQIFLVEQTPDGVWDRAVLLSSAYNTGCEVAPFFAHDNKTFFFSSYRDVADSAGARLSRKNFNVFWAKIDGLFEFQPKPIYPIVNKGADQVSFSMDADQNIYYGSGDIFKSSEKKRSSQIIHGILESGYEKELVTQLQGTITDDQGNPLEAIVEVIDPFTSKVYDQLESDERGYYQSFLPTEVDFQLVISKDTYSVQSRLLRTTGPRDTFDFELFKHVKLSFNVFDYDYYFPLTANAQLVDDAFNEVDASTVSPNGGTAFDVALGQTYHVIFSAPNYRNDTLHLPFDKEVLFPEYTFDIELERALSGVDLVFTDDETGENLDLEITVYNVTRNEKITRRVKDGKIHLDLREGEEYEISTSAQGYSYYTASVDLTKAASQKEIKAELKSIANASLVLDNITFEYNSYNLNAASYEELNKLVAYLQANGIYKVQISAFTDDSGGENYNLKLSRKRANSVLEYLQDHAIKATRLIAIGYGEENPLFPNNSEENRALNRRVEFKILNPNESN